MAKDCFRFNGGDGLEDLLHNLVMFDFHNSLPKKGIVNLVEPDLSWAIGRT